MIAIGGPPLSPQLGTGPQEIEVNLSTRRYRSRRRFRARRQEKVSGLVAAVSIILLLVAVLLAFAQWVSGGYTEPRQQKQFATYDLKSDLILDGTITGVWPTGMPVALLRIPRFDRSLAIGAGVSRSDLRNGPGFAPESTFPGRDGNTVIVGKSTTYLSPFSDIKRLKEGDQIVLTSPIGTFAYLVASVKTVPDGDKAILEETKGGRLSLVTHSGGLFSHKSVLVRAERTVGTAASTREMPTIPGTKERSAAPIVILALLAIMVVLVYGLIQGLGNIISRKAALWLVCPILLALTVPLMMQLLLLFPRGY